MIDDPIKIRWTGDARSKLSTRNLEPRIEDGSDEAKTAKKTLTRLTTLVVVKTEDEAQALLDALQQIKRRIPTKGAGTSDHGCVWMANSHVRAFERVEDDLKNALRERGLCGFESVDGSKEITCGKCGEVYEVDANVDAYCCCNIVWDEDGKDEQFS